MALFCGKRVKEKKRRKKKKGKDEQPLQVILRFVLLANNSLCSFKGGLGRYLREKEKIEDDPGGSCATR